MIATVLVQAEDPGPGANTGVAALIRDLDDRNIDDVVPLIGAYDAAATVTSKTPQGIGAAVVRIQEIDGVAMTLTLAHVDEPQENDDE